MPETSQSYPTHKRFLGPFHFFALPILAINVIVTLVPLVRTPSLGAAWQVLVAMALVTIGLTSRWMSNRLQDRIIRHEERARLARLAPAVWSERLDALTVDQFVGLRFAGDTEVVALAERCVAGDVATRDAVKRAVRTWREDHLRV